MKKTAKKIIAGTTIAIALAGATTTQHSVNADEVTNPQESTSGQDSLDTMKNQVEQDKADVDNANQAIQDQQEVVNKAQQEVDEAESQFNQALSDEVKAEEWNRFAQGQKEDGDQRVAKAQEAVNQAQQEVDKATQEEAVKQSDFDNVDKSYQEAQQQVTEAENTDSAEKEAVNQAQQEYEQAQQEASQAEEDYKTAAEEADKKQAELEKAAKEAEEAVNQTDSEIIQKEKEYQQNEEASQRQAKKAAEDYYNLSKTKNPRVELPEGYDIRNKEHTAVINFNADIPKFDKNVNASEDDFNNIVDIQNPTDSQIKEINEFIAQIVNDVRSQVGRPRVGVTTSNIKEAEAIAKDNEAHNSTNAVYLNSTNHPTVGFDVEFDGVSYGVGVSNAFQTHTDLKKKSASMAEIKEDLFNALMKIFFSIEARGNLSKAETLILNGYDLGAHYAFYENNGDPISQLVIAFCWSDDNPYDSGDDNAKYMDNYRKLGMAQGGDVAKAVQKVYDDDVNASSKAFVSKTELQNLETKRAKQAKALDEATLAYQTFYDEASSKAFDNIRTTIEKETVASVKYNNALKALYQKQQEKALKVAKAKQALVPIEAKREEAQKALDIAKQNTAKAQYDLRVAKGDLSEAVIFKELKDKVAKNAKEDLAKADEIVDKWIAVIDTARAKYNTEKAKLPKLEEAYKLALDKYNKDKDLYDTLVKAQEENNKHNQEVPTPSQGESSKGEETPEQPKEETPTKGEETPEQPKEETPTKGEETPEQPKEEIPTKGEVTPEQPKEETPTKGEETSEQPKEEIPTKGEVTPEQPKEETPTKGEVTPEQPKEETPTKGEVTPEQPKEETPSKGEVTPEQHKEETPTKGETTKEPTKETVDSKEENTHNTDNKSIDTKDSKSTVTPKEESKEIVDSVKAKPAKPASTSKGVKPIKSTEFTVSKDTNNKELPKAGMANILSSSLGMLSLAFGAVSNKFTKRK